MGVRTTLEDAQAQVLAYVRTRAELRTALLAGNTICTDWLPGPDMPELRRTFNTARRRSSIKELAALVPEGVQQPPGRHASGVGRHPGVDRGVALLPGDDHGRPTAHQVGDPRRGAQAPGSISRNDTDQTLSLPSYAQWWG